MYEQWSYYSFTQAISMMLRYDVVMAVHLNPCIISELCMRPGGELQYKDTVLPV